METSLPMSTFDQGRLAKSDESLPWLDRTRKGIIPRVWKPRRPASGITLKESSKKEQGYSTLKPKRGYLTKHDSALFGKTLTDNDEPRKYQIPSTIDDVEHHNPVPGTLVYSDYFEPLPVCNPSAPELKLVLPSAFLGLDIYCLRNSVCSEMTDHDESKCICVSFMANPAGYWTSPSGLSARARDVIISGLNHENKQLRDCFGNTALHLIAARSNPNILFQSLEKARDEHMEATNSGGQTFLHVLRKDWFRNDFALLPQLIEQCVAAGVDISTQDAYGQTLAHLAVRGAAEGSPMEEILQHFDKRTLSKRDAFGRRPDCPILPQRALNETHSVGENMTQKPPIGSAAVSSLWHLDPAAPLMTADISEVAAYARILRKTASQALKFPELEDSQGRNGLHCLAVATSSRLQCLPSDVYETRITTTLEKSPINVSKLLAKGVDVNAYNTYGNTVLMDFIAFLPEDVDNMHVDVILQLLINAGANLESRNRRGETDILVAARCCRKTALRRLILSGANTKARDAFGRDASSYVNEGLAKFDGGIEAQVGFEKCLEAFPSNHDLQAATATSEWSFKRNDEPILNQGRYSERSTSMESLPQDVDVIVDDICDMILSQAFGQLTDDLARPQDALICVRQCLTELQIVVNEDQDSASEVTNSSDQEYWDNDSEPQSGSRSQRSSGSNTGSRKRSLNSQDAEEDGLSDRESGSGHEGSDKGGSRTKSTHVQKRAKVTKRISCPFRKRNPTKFNVRDHRICATSHFSTISLVKCHVASVHKLDPSKINQIVTCGRCKERFTTSRHHEAHIRVPLEQMCPIRDLTDNLVDTPDPEDGISPEVDSKLRDRRNDKSVTTWDSLWRTLFPGDDVSRTEDFEPVIEVEELKEGFQQNTETCISALQKLSVDMALDTSRVTPQEFSQMLLALFQTFINHALQTCRKMLISPSGPGSQRMIKTSKTKHDWNPVSFSVPRQLLPRSLSMHQTVSPRSFPLSLEFNVSSALPDPAPHQNPAPLEGHIAEQSLLSLTPEGGAIDNLRLPFQNFEDEVFFSAQLPVRSGEGLVVGRDTCDLCSQQACGCFDDLLKLHGENDEQINTSDEFGIPVELR